MEQTVEKLQTEAAKLQAEFNALMEPPKDHQGLFVPDRRKELELRQSIRETKRALKKALSEGCVPCPGCKAPALGMPQQVSLRNEIVDGFEIRCPALCSKKYRQFGFTAEGAKRDWNAKFGKTD